VRVFTMHPPKIFLLGTLPCWPAYVEMKSRSHAHAYIIRSRHGISTKHCHYEKLGLGSGVASPLWSSVREAATTTTKIL
jgi:hypothetical protein